MNTGVALLLKRMETHPEEFIMRINHGTSQWGMLIHQFEDHLDEEDHIALKAGIRKCHQEVFTGKVMQALAGEDVTSEEGKLPYLAPIGMLSGGATQGTYTLNNNGAQVSWENREPLGHALDAVKYQNEMMRRHLDEHRDALNKVEVNKKPLIKRIFK